MEEGGNQHLVAPADIDVDIDGTFEVSTTSQMVASAVTRKLLDLDVNSVLNYRPTICRASHDTKADDDGTYSPKLVSIGPYHCGKDTLRPMQEIKLLYVHDLLARSSHNKLERYAEAVLLHEGKVRQEYSEPIDQLSSKEFVEMLVLDGCFIVEFLLKRAEGSVGMPLTAHVRNMPMLRRDLLLMENQIPFFVLKIILEETEYDFPGSDGITLLDLALHYLQKGKIKREMLPEKYQEGDGENVYHLLHLSYLCITQGLAPTSPRTCPPPETLGDHLLEKIGSLVSLSILSLLFLLRNVTDFLSIFLISVPYVIVSFFEVLIMWKIPSWYASPKIKSSSTKPRMIPTATELTETGVSFKRKEIARCYLDVSFNDGKMEIPTVQVQENSKSEFRNFLALEQSCPDVGNNFTSYVVLMDNLVDTNADVALLKQSGILEGKLGCDEDVAKFFNGMRSGLCFDFDKHYLAGLFVDVNDYCNMDRNRWRATLMRNYFGKPYWTIFTLTGARILLGLEAVQTAYAINTTFGTLE